VVLPELILNFLKIKDIERKPEISGVGKYVHNLSKTVDLFRILTKMTGLKTVVFKAS
jgi:hypothetical protein